MDWRTLFPAFYPEKNDKEENIDNKCSKVEFADIGCGYGGLLGICNMYNNNIYSVSDTSYLEKNSEFSLQESDLWPSK